MDGNMKGRSPANQSEDEMGIRKGPWTVEEDAILTNYIGTHGEGRWNSVARSAGKPFLLCFTSKASNFIATIITPSFVQFEIREY